MFEELAADEDVPQVMLATDLHAGNVVRARREPRLVVDATRMRRWMFARAAADDRDRWDEDSMELARALAP